MTAPAFVPATGNTGAATSFTPAFTGAAAGDTEFLYAFRSTAATVPTVPSGWTLLLSGSGNTCAGFLAYRFCPSATPAATGAITGATQTILSRYNNVLGIGNIAGSNAASTSIAYPALTAVETGGNSWYLGVAGHRTASNVNTPPTGMTNRYSVGAGPQAALHDTNGGVSSWSLQSVTVNANSGHESFTVELLADNGAFSLYNSSGSSTWSLSTENRVATSTVSPNATNCISTFTSHSTGKWYFLGRLLVGYGTGGSDMVTGWSTRAAPLTTWPGGVNNLGIAFGFNAAGTDNQWINHTATNNSAIYNHPAVANDFFHFCIDLTNGLVWVKHDSMPDWNNNPSASPDTGVGGFAYTDVIGQELFIFTGTGNLNSTFAINTVDVSQRPADASTFQGWDIRSGGNVYNVSISESGSAADTVSSVANLVASILESMAAADSPSSQATLGATITEAGTANDNVSAQVSSSNTISETASAADTVSNGNSFSVNISEGGNAVDTVSETLSISASIAETGSAADQVSSQVVAASTIAEAASAVDTESVTIGISVAIAEAGSASDTVSSKGTLVGVIVEAASALEQVSSQGTLAAAILEAANAQDTESAPAPGVNIIVETMNAQDTVSCVVISSNTITEAASAADNVSMRLTLSAQIVEAGSATDVVSAQAMLAAVIAEFGVAQDVASAVVMMACEILEDADAVDIVSAGGQIIASACNTLSGPYRVRVLAGLGRVRILTGAARVRTLKGPCC